MLKKTDIIQNLFFDQNGNDMDQVQRNVSRNSQIFDTYLNLITLKQTSSFRNKQQGRLPKQHGSMCTQVFYSLVSSWDRF